MIFDAPQGKTYLKDFNIEEEAKGVGKSIIKEYDVDVTSSTLEIHLYWAGKGTNFIPSDFVYGPQISAIAVTSSELIRTVSLSSLYHLIFSSYYYFHIMIYSFFYFVAQTLCCSAF